MQQQRQMDLVKKMMELLVLEMASGILARENATLSRPTLRRVNNKL